MGREKKKDVGESTRIAEATSIINIWKKICGLLN